MLLSSLNKIKELHGLALTPSEPLSDDIELANMLQATSQRIEKYCKRRFKKTTYTQKFDPDAEQTSIRVLAYPIESITSVEVDSTGLFNGNQTAIDPNAYRVSADGRDIEFNHGVVPLIETGISTLPSPIRIIYVGGISAHATISILQIDDMDGTPSVGDLLTGEDSGAKGRVTKVQLGVVIDVDPVDLISLEMSYGAFEDGETITGGNMTDGTINSHYRTSLAESDAALVQACEIQTWYLKKNHTNLENATFEGNTVVRRSPGSDLAADYNFLPEVRSALAPYKNNLIDFQDRG